jgi:hypothetical protein
MIQRRVVHAPPGGDKIRPPLSPEPNPGPDPPRAAAGPVGAAMDPPPVVDRRSGAGPVGAGDGAAWPIGCLGAL